MTGFLTYLFGARAGRDFPARRLYRDLTHEARIRRGIRDMGNLDAHLLRDIGLHPGDIPDAARFGRDFWMIRERH